MNSNANQHQNKPAFINFSSSNIIPQINSNTINNQFNAPRPTACRNQKSNSSNDSGNQQAIHNSIVKFSSLPISIQSQKVFYTPLSQLTTFSKDFTILVRITKKSAVKNYNSHRSKSQGRLFNLNIMDIDKTEMQITCFNRGVDKFYELIDENKIYSIYGGYINLNDRKFFSGENKSEYKLVIDENCTIMEMPDDGTIDSNLNFSFLKISKIFEPVLYSVVDLNVFILECGDTQLKTTKNGDLPLRKLIVCDDSEFKVQLTLWRNHAEIPLEMGQFLLIKNAKVGEFNGRNFSSYDDTKIIINPENSKETEQLKNFIQNFQGEFKKISTLVENTFNSNNSNNNDNSYNNEIYFMQEILDLIEFGFENIEDFNNNKNLKRIKGTITQMIHNDRNFYAGCPDNGCKRKLLFNDDSQNFICSYCSKVYSNPAYYYNLSLRVKDSSCEHWIDLFGSNAEKILRISADEYRLSLLNGDTERMKEINKNIEFKTFYFLVKPKIQQFNGKLKKKIYAYKFEPVVYALETKRLVEKLTKQFNIIGNGTLNSNSNANYNNNYNNNNKNSFSFDINNSRDFNKDYIMRNIKQDY